MWRTLDGVETIFGKLGVTEVPSWTQEVMDFLEKVLDGRGTCHHPDEGQILTTTNSINEKR